MINENSKYEGRIHMSKRRKRLIIVLIILAAIYLLLIGGSYLYLKLYISPVFEQGYKVTGVYPYSNAAIPDDFAEYSMAGLKLSAPDCLESEIDLSVHSQYTSQDASKCDLRILATVEKNGVGWDLKWMREENPNLFVKWLSGCGWLMKHGMKKIGCEIPESDHEWAYLLERADPLNYNKFSLSEAYASVKLSTLAAIMVPANMGTKDDEKHPLEQPLNVEECAYYLESDAWNAIIRQRRSRGGRYQLTVTYYLVSDDENVRTLLVQSDDPELAQTVVASAHPA